MDLGIFLVFGGGVEVDGVEVEGEALLPVLEEEPGLEVVGLEDHPEGIDGHIVESKVDAGGCQSLSFLLFLCFMLRLLLVEVDVCLVCLLVILFV